jgi:DNA repair exonuclease SbcCD ATPase subunit
MQKHPMLSVKETAELLKLDERTIRERLINGQLKGEKRNKGLREIWFVYRGAVDAILAQESRDAALFGSSSTEPGANQSDLKGQEPSFAQARPAGAHVQGNGPVIDTSFKSVSGQTFFQSEQGPSEAEFETFSESNESDRSSEQTTGTREEKMLDWLHSEREKITMVIEAATKPLVERLERQIAELREKENIIEDQARQLRLIPDFQKQAEQEREAAQLKEHEVNSLKTQISLLEPKLSEAESIKKRAEELENEVLAEREKAKKQVSQLEQSMAELRAEEERKREELSREREEREAAIREQLAGITEQLQKLQQPWWKKVFGGGGGI